MPLIDLKTDLKSLKYGLDRRGLGSSREPFITEPIPDGETPGASRDMLLRQGALQSSINDTSRLTKLFTTTRGLNFVANQNLLSRTSVKTEASVGPAYLGGQVNQGVYLPSSTLSQVGIGFEGTHLNLLGLDPSSPMAGVSEGGLLPGLGLVRYEQAVFNKNQIGLNRLVLLKNNKIDLDPNSTQLRSYGGGPGSILGVGRTNIKRVSNTTGINPYGNPAGGFKSVPATKTSSAKTYFNLNFPSSSVAEITYGAGSNSSLATGTSITSSIDRSGVRISQAKTYFNDNSPSGSISDVTYGTVADNKVITLDSAYTKGTNASLKHPGPTNPNYKSPLPESYTAGDDIGGDKFNKAKSRLLNTSTVNSKPDDDQLFKFYLNFIDPDTPGADNYLYWQAYVDNFSDQVGAEYDSYNYVGRGYPLYRYKGFTRKIATSFTIVAHSEEEIVPIYRKLNTLIQRLAPNYSNDGYLRGSFVKLTFGDYLNNVPGILDGFTLSPIYDAGFETTDGKQLAKAIKVDGFNFTPIADNSNKLISNTSTFISV